jgi:hypothetical protein
MKRDMEHTDKDTLSELGTAGSGEIAPGAMAMLFV